MLSFQRNIACDRFAAARRQKAGNSDSRQLGGESHLYPLRAVCDSIYLIRIVAINGINLIQ